MDAAAKRKGRKNKNKTKQEKKTELSQLRWTNDREHTDNNRYPNNYTNTTAQHAGRPFILLSVVWTAQAM